MSIKTTRRDFLKSASIGIAVGSLSGIVGGCTKQKQIIKRENSERIKLGLASYTFREFSLDETIVMTKRIGLKYIALKSFHLPLESTKDEIIKSAEKVRSSGLDLYGCSVVDLTNENEVNQIFEYAKNAGMRVIMAQPEQNMLELINKKVKEYNIMLAIHNHGPEDKNFPTPKDAYEKIKNLDSRIGLCIDIGHTRRSGADPSESIEKFSDRLLDVHIKDIKTMAGEDDPIEVGRGVLDIPKVLNTLIKINFSGIVSLEYEKDGKDPLPGSAESIGYIKGILSVI